MAQVVFLSDRRSAASLVYIPRTLTLATASASSAAGYVDLLLYQKIGVGEHTKRFLAKHLVVRSRVVYETFTRISLATFGKRDACIPAAEAFAMSIGEKGAYAPCTVENAVMIAIAYKPHCTSKRDTRMVIGVHPLPDETGRLCSLVLVFGSAGYSLTTEWVDEHVGFKPNQEFVFKMK